MASKPSNEYETTAQIAAKRGVNIYTVRRWVGLGCPHRTVQTGLQTHYELRSNEVDAWLTARVASRRSDLAHPDGHTSSVEQIVSYHPDGTAVVRMTTVQTSGAHILDLSDQRWDRMSHKERTAHNAYTWAIHCLAIEHAELPPDQRQQVTDVLHAGPGMYEPGVYRAALDQVQSSDMRRAS
jgi:hypothetical protein